MPGPKEDMVFGWQIIALCVVIGDVNFAKFSVEYLVEMSPGSAPMAGEKLVKVVESLWCPRSLQAFSTWQLYCQVLI